MATYELLPVGQGVADENKIIKRTETKTLEVTSQVSVAKLKQEYTALIDQITMLQTRADAIFADLQNISDANLVQFELPTQFISAAPIKQ